MKIKHSAPLLIFMFFFFAPLFLSCGSGNKITAPRQTYSSSTSSEPSSSSDEPTPRTQSPSRHQDILSEHLESQSLSHVMESRSTRISAQNRAHAATIENASNCFTAPNESLRSLLPRAQRITDHIEESLMPLLVRSETNQRSYFQLDEVGLLYSSDSGDQQASIELSGLRNTENPSMIDAFLHQCSHAYHTFTLASGRFRTPLRLSASLAQGQQQGIIAVLAQVNLLVRRSPHSRGHQVSVQTSGSLSLTEEPTTDITSLRGFLKHTSNLDHQAFLLQDGRLLLVLSSFGSEHVVKRMWSTYTLRVLNQ